MNDEMRKLQAEMEAIDEVKRKKDMDNKQLLEEALRRVGGEQLAKNDFMAEEDKALLVESLLDDRL